MSFFNKLKFKEEEDEDKLNDLFKEACKSGAVLAKFHFDAHGKNAEGVTNSLVQFVGRLSKENGVIYCKGEVDEALQGDDKVWSSNAEVSILVEGFHVLIYLCFNYAPWGIEIEKPEKQEFTANDLQGFLLDVSKISQDYSKYIFEQVISDEKREELLMAMDKRAELGKKMRDEAEKKKD